MRNCTSAFTLPGFDPPYFNVTECDDHVEITVRGKMDERVKCSVCGIVPHSQPQAAICVSKEAWESIKRQIVGTESP